MRDTIDYLIRLRLLSIFRYRESNAIATTNHVAAKIQFSGRVMGAPEIAAVRISMPKNHVVQAAMGFFTVLCSTYPTNDNNSVTSKIASNGCPLKLRAIMDPH
jgi:hypothetical protein